MRKAKAVAALALALLALPAGLAGQAAADSAWNAGDFDRAERLYEERLVADSADVRALHRLALMAAWEGRTGRSLELLDRLLRLHPGHRAARRDRAMVLSWAGRLDAARAVYGELVAADSSDLRSLEGLATVRSWQDDLSASEKLWRRVLEQDPDRASAVAGLARILRWEGRPAAARAVLRREVRHPDLPELLREERWVDAALSPSVSPAASWEADSDENRIWTARLDASVHLVPRLELAARTYARRASDGGGAGPGRRTAESAGGLLELSLALEPGWQLTAGGGAVAADSGLDGGIASWRASVASPRHLPVRVDVAYRREPLDATRRLIREGIELELLDVGVTVAPGAGWELAASFAPARFLGPTDNDRLAGRFAVRRRLGAEWTVGAEARALAYDRNLDLGYFDPDFYGLAEALVRWRSRPGPWLLQLDVRPGAQQVGEDGAVEGAFSAGTVVGVRLSPGNEIVLSGDFTTNGLQSFSTGEADWRYGRVALGARLTF